MIKAILPERFHRRVYQRFLLNLLVVGLTLGLFWESSSAATLVKQVRVAVPGAVSTFNFLDDNAVMVGVKDAAGKPITGLGKQDFTLLSAGNQTADVLSVESLSTAKTVGLNIVMVLDNSFSIYTQQALDDLKQALTNFFKALRPSDRLTIVTFDDKQTIRVEDRQMHLQIHRQVDFVNSPEAFIKKLEVKHLVQNTYLHEAIYAGMSELEQIPKSKNRILVVFTDGKDRDSGIELAALAQKVTSVGSYRAYCVDFQKTPEPDRFLSYLSQSTGGQIWKADNADRLIPIFDQLAQEILHHYIVHYEFVTPIGGTLQMLPSTVTISEITTIDASPFLNHIYFATADTAIPERYRLLSGQEEVRSFKPQSLRGTMDKYYHILNIVGYRLKAHPEATVTLVGCNSHYGPERGRRDISAQRAETVKGYLQYVWGINGKRLQTEARGRPSKPSASDTDTGRQENQRVEIHSDTPAILAPVESRYLQVVPDPRLVRISPEIATDYGVKNWTLKIHCAQQPLQTVTGKQKAPAAQLLDLARLDLQTLTGCDALHAELSATDGRNRTIRLEAAKPVTINVTRQQERSAQREGYQVLEKYALILFNFNTAKIEAGGRQIIDGIVDRIRIKPDARVDIVGYTDDIGKADYNLRLSERRAKAVTGAVSAGENPAPDGGLNSYGLGEEYPLYDNALPEGRALNRTVTVTLDYIELTD